MLQENLSFFFLLERQTCSHLLGLHSSIRKLLQKQRGKQRLALLPSQAFVVYGQYHYSPEPGGG